MNVAALPPTGGTCRMPETDTECSPALARQVQNAAMTGGRQARHG